MPCAKIVQQRKYLSKMILFPTEFLRDFYNVLRAQAELLQQLGRGAGMAELVVDADAANGSGALFAEQAANRLTQTAVQRRYTPEARGGGKGEV